MGELGAYLRTLRRHLRMSQRDAAAKSGVSDAYICQVETGTRPNPHPNILRKIAAAYGEEVETLMELAGYLDAERPVRDKGYPYSSASSEWETPQDLFDRLNAVFGFTLDVCATDDNSKCGEYFTREEDGLQQEWFGRCWMNPPYGKDISRWVEKAYREASERGLLVVALLPVRTDTTWWQRWVQGSADVHFLKGRVGFLNPEHEGRTRAPFPSAIAVWWPKPKGGDVLDCMKRSDRKS